MACWEPGQHIGITAPFENVSESNNTLHMLKTNDESENSIPNNISELSIPDTYFDRKPQTHHMVNLTDNPNKLIPWISYRTNCNTTQTTSTPTSKVVNTSIKRL